MKEQCPLCGHVFSITGDPSPNMGFFVDDVELDKHDGEEIAFYLFKGLYKFRRTILCTSCRRLSFRGEQAEFERTVLKMANESVKEAMDVATVAWRAGVAAYIDGKGKDANPVRAEGSDAETSRLAWEAGWNAGKVDLDHRLLTIGGVDSSFTYYPPVQNVAALPENAEEHDARWVESEGEPYVYSAKRGAWESAENHVKADEVESRGDALENKEPKK